MYKLIWVRNPDLAPVPTDKPPVVENAKPAEVLVNPSDLSTVPSTVNSKVTGTTNGLKTWQYVFIFAGATVGFLSGAISVVLPFVLSSSQISQVLKPSVSYDVPTGTVIMYGGSPSTMPGTVNQWLYCNGSAVSRTTFKNLFQIIGITYGSGDSSTTFNLPDFRTKFPYGTASSTSSFTNGGNSHITLSSAQLPAHSHTSGTLTANNEGTHAHSITDSGHSHGGATTARLFLNGPYSAYGTGISTTNGYNLYWVSSATLGINNGATGISINTDGAHTHTISGSTDPVGTGASINILPPYQTIHFIIRT